jgi:hypothetical protein
VWGTDDLKYYYTELFIGKDRQKTSVIIDTGSDYLAFPCTSKFLTLQISKHAATNVANTSIQPTTSKSPKMLRLSSAIQKSTIFLAKIAKMANAFSDVPTWKALA